MTETRIYLASEEDTIALGRRLAAALKPPLVLYLSGELGAGKTTFSRGLIQSLGHQGAVKSPTYTLVEPYELPDVEVYHFDLYRLADPEELEFMGIRDYFTPNSLCIVEWPERGQGLLPAADIQLQLKYANSGRELILTSATAAGDALINSLK
ncbi:tRNA (adenosine(37)-N6)-threonylcarbamoyltransferase complex ATPase subunit type 1 TsaE [Shewanella sedimentimangrovi]|uniref:tRNA threonylcarbamoyladenosine biosynthesis protein TsaE n=1 Tax=Shewanella sedimentimangrovi TaxID=2814293 RepID=A0ABX7QYN3_9GAMM|nr:tRNA (adenosine(37)-N6)-threonylcarbamoyltransferase complex ATPase subunit type 1 TsaE [Shewanella sedimentimangrovi]QSX36647.1 tRNA (adenosine(37)-N6)-threonylcarbamoyltransferase complex ATPase subunit type 1 TsaE [Shewanella sedimentimangrovi]